MGLLSLQPLDVEDGLGERQRREPRVFGGGDDLGLVTGWFRFTSGQRRG